ncbi:oxidoreductase [Longibacter salinarum]|uniref:Oxidoreductase n=1 Tax=Longibacter salinarum TaxID=1850348 RepID=A0A2A8D2M8_9BACT|nr:zinc-binding alcohol dehydrogenase [Longibacter salinarum]PEN15063.1 oxidoreductase [Longibacter salinarum]
MPPVSSRDILVFGGDESVSIRSEKLEAPGHNEVQVTTHVSAISAGTERLVYEGSLPAELASDATIDALENKSSDLYPTTYGYASAGRVTALGNGVSDAWLGRKVFAFHPHATHFNAAVSSLIPLPDDLPLENAVLYPNMETAIGLVMDGRPVLGERVSVFGLGLVGLLVTWLLSDFPLQTLLAIDPVAQRRSLAADLGASTTADPQNTQKLFREMKRSQHADPTVNPEGGADLVYELSGRPETIDDGISICGYAGRILVGSWYGTKTAPVDLGRRYHRSHITIRASQVSTIGPEHRPRWSKSRRGDVVMRRLANLPTEILNTVDRPFHDAAETYQMLSEPDSSVVQILHKYADAKQV